MIEMTEEPFEVTARFLADPDLDDLDDFDDLDDLDDLDLDDDDGTASFLSSSPAAPVAMSGSNGSSGYAAAQSFAVALSALVRTVDGVRRECGNGLADP